MNPSVPHNSTSSTGATADFEKYEDFILEEYMDMTYGNNEQTSSGLVHPEDKTLFERSSGTKSETQRPREQECSHEHVFDQNESQGSIFETLNESRGNNQGITSALKSGHAPIDEQTLKMPQKNYYHQNLFNPEESRRFDLFDHADKEQGISMRGIASIPTTSKLNCNHGPPSQSVQQRQDLVDMEREGYFKGSSDASGGMWPPQVTADSGQPSSSKWWNHDQTIDLGSSSEALPNLPPQGIQPIKIEGSYPASQMTQTLHPLATGYPVGTEIFISSDDSVSDTLVNEWPEERPSVIVPPGAPVEGLQYHADMRIRTNPVIAGGGLHQRQEWRDTTSNYPGQQFTHFTHAIPQSRENGLSVFKYNQPAENIIPFTTAAWDHSIQDSSIIDQQCSRTDESRHMGESAQGASIHYQNTNDYRVEPHVNLTDSYDSSRVVHPRFNTERIGAHPMGTLAHSHNIMWPQPNNPITTMDYGNEGGFYDDHAIQRLAMNFAHHNQPTNETAEAPDREMTSNDTAFEALASIGLFPYPCNDPNCPGDISRQFQEFPFPRKKSAGRAQNHSPYQMSPIPSSSNSGSEGMFSEIFEVDPNQEEQRLQLRRMRNREAAKRCRKKKKQEFIALLLKRAMLLAEYHRCYHSLCQRNIPPNQ